MDPAALIADARNYSAQTLTQAQSALTSASSQISAIGYLVPNPQEVLVNDLQDPDPLPSAPYVDSVGPDVSTTPPDAPDYEGIDWNLRDAAEPRLDARRPTLSTPSRPSSLAGFGQSAPTITTDAQFPDAPEFIEPPAPTLRERAEPTKPQINLPEFNGQMPQAPGAPPDDMPEQLEALHLRAHPRMAAVIDAQADAYMDSINPEFRPALAAAEAQLAKYLEGGTALKPAVEDAIYERARDKAAAEYERTHSAAWAVAAARGFTMPDSTATAAMLYSRQGLADNMARTGVEIAVKQAEMEQENLKFAVTTSLDLRKAVVQATLSYHSNQIQINGQALDFAKTALDMLLRAYETQVRVFQAKVEAYRADAQVYEIRLKGALAQIDIYKAEIDALQALTQVDLAQVQVYRARIDVMQALAGVYKTRVDAIVSKAELEKLKIDLFRVQVQAYGEQVNAKNSEWSGYKAAIDGNDALVRMYATEVGAYTAEVGAWGKKIDAAAEEVRAKVAMNQTKVQQYEAALRAYTAVAGVRGDIARTRLENERTKISAYSAEVQAKLGYAQAGAQVYKARADVAIANATQSMNAQQLHQKSMESLQGTIAQLGSANANIYAGLANAALSGMNSVVSTGQ